MNVASNRYIPVVPVIKSTLLTALCLQVGCSSGSVGDGSSKSAANQSVSKSGDAPASESTQAELPTEIAGGFLTCAYVTPEETGFSPSSTHVPVGCVVKMDGSKITDRRYAYKLKLLSSQKEVEPLTTKIAQSASEWHQYAHLERAGQQDKDLGMIVQDLDSGAEYGPLLYPVRNLGLSLDATLDLAGSYVAGGYYQRAPQNGQQPTRLAEWGIIPEAFCKDGQRLPVTDRTKDPGIMGVPGVQELGTILDATLGTKMSNLEIESQEIRTKQTADTCLQKTKVRDLARGGLMPQPLPGGGEYVVEGGGCLFISSFGANSEWRVTIYDKNDRQKYGIVKENLETFVGHYINQRKTGKIKVKCPAGY